MLTISEFAKIVKEPIFLLEDLKNRNLQSIDLEALGDNYPIREMGNEIRIGALIKVTHDIDENKILETESIIGTKAGNIWTVQIPIRRIKGFTNIKGIDYIEIDTYSGYAATMDQTRELCDINEVHQGLDLPKEYMGEGVIIGIMDYGFDYRHPTFRDEDLQNFRIKKIWHQLEDSGMPPSGFDYGSEYSSENEILNSITDNLAEYHGTPVASIAGGSGALSNEKYRGMAPKADLLIVGADLSYDWDAQISTNWGSQQIDALSWMFQYAESVGKPIVVNRSLFSDTGAHDGTDLFEQAIANLVGEGKIFVNGAGNSRDEERHISVTFNQEDNKAEVFVLLPDEFTILNRASVDIWYDGRPENFKVVLSAVDTVSGARFDSTVVSSSTVEGLVSDWWPGLRYLQKGYYSKNFPTNGKARVYFTLNKRPEDSTILYTLRFEGEEDQTLHAWIHNGSECCEKFSNLDSIDFLSPDEFYTTNYTNDAIITVGAYKFIDRWTSYGGDTLPPPQGWIPGEITDYSSWGPSLDGRIKPDIVAPADFIVAAESNAYLNHNGIDISKYVNIHDAVEYNGEKWYYSYFNGTSAAAPVVTGIVALMLEVDPTLDPFEVRKLLQENATLDQFTGATPNNIYGYGKVNAHQTILALQDKISTERILDSKLSVSIYPNPSNGMITIEGMQPGSTFELLSSYGQVVKSVTFRGNNSMVIDISDLPNGIYLASARSKRSHYSSKLVKTK